MILQVPSSPAQWFRLWSRVAAILTIGIGVAVILGWVFDVAVLKRVLPTLQDMNPLVAVNFILGGSALLAINYQGERVGRYADAVGAFLTFCGLARLGCYYGFWTWHIDWILFSDQLGRTATGIPNSIAPSTAYNTLFLGYAILLRDAWKSRSSWPSMLLLVAVSSVAMVAFLGYLYGARNLYDFGAHFVPMALHTAVGFLLLASGWLSLHPERGFMAVVANAAPSGLTTRRLACGGFLIPIFLGWLAWTGQRLGWYLPLLSVVIFAIETAFVFLVLILWSGWTLRRFEAERAGFELEIRESEERFRLLAESAFEGIVVIGEDTILDANRRVCQMFGLELTQVVGHRQQDSLRTEAMDGTSLLTASAREGVRQGSATRRDGSTFEIEVESRTIPYRNGRALVAAVRDITERKEIDRVKEEFVSVVSHELRTPLTSIHGALGLLLGGVAGEVSQSGKSMLEIARRNSNRLLLLINDILDMQKIESGGLEFQRESVLLRDLIESSIESNTAYAREMGVSLLAAELDGDAVVWVDPDRLMQVLANLISNACKFSFEGGVVEIHSCRCATGVRVEVSDKGPGIPANFQMRIFEKFAQADSSDTRRKGGTGLGLSISRAIVERLGGTIGFRTVVGEGTTFYFELPLAPVTAEMDERVEQEAVDRAGIFTV